VGRADVRYGYVDVADVCVYVVCGVFGDGVVGVGSICVGVVIACYVGGADVDVCADVCCCDCERE